MVADYVLSAKITADSTGFKKGTDSAEASLKGLFSYSDKGFEGMSTKAVAVGNIIANGFSRVMGIVSSSIGSAINRVDTLNKFPKMMENLGYSANDAKQCVDRLSDGIEGLPTSLDQIVSNTQQLTLSLNDLNKSTDVAIALNDGFITFGASSEQVTNAITQLNQMVTAGKYDMQSWNSINQSAPGFLDAVARSMLGSTKKAKDLRDALNDNKVSSDDFLNAIVKLDKEGGKGIVAFSESARTASGGIETSMANAHTAIVKNVANIINALNGDGNIAALFDAIKISINQVGKSIEPFAAMIGNAIGPVFREFSDQMADGASIADAFSAAMGKMPQDFQNLYNMVKPVATLIGDSLGPAFKTLGDNLMSGKSIIESLKAAFDKLPIPIKDLLVVLAALKAKSIFTSIMSSGLKMATTLVSGFNSVKGVCLSVKEAFQLVRGGAATVSEGFGLVKSSSSTLTSGLSALKTGLAGLGIGAAIAVVGFAVTKFQEWQDHVAAVDKATNGLRDSMSSFGSAFGESTKSLSDASSSADDYALNLGEVKKRTQAMIESNGQLADTISGIFSNAGQQVGELSYYREAIEQLAGKSLDSSEDVAKLELAVKQLSDATGKSLEVVKESDGTYQVYADGAKMAKDAILELIDAQKMQVQLQANQEAWSEAYKTLEENARTAEEAQKAYQEAVSKNQGITEAYNNMVEANAAYKEQSDLVQHLADNQTLLQIAQDKGAKSFEYLLANNERAMAAFNSSGESAQEFIQDLKDVGVKQSELSSIGAENLASLARSYDGNISSIAGMLQEYEVNINDAKLQQKQSLEEMESMLGDIGVSWSDFGDLSAKQLKDLQNNCGDSLDSLVEACEDRGIEVPQALADAIKQNSNTAQDAAENMGENVDKSIASGIEGSSDQPVGALQNLKPQLTSVFGDANSLLRNAGSSMMSGLAEGIYGSLSIATQAMEGAMASIRAKVPSSPAKEGPFSGRGWVLYSGMSIMDAISDGVKKRTPNTASVMSKAMGKLRNAINSDFSVSPLAVSALLGGRSSQLATQAGAITISFDRAKALEVDGGIAGNTTVNNYEMNGMTIEDGTRMANLMQEAAAEMKMRERA